MGRHGSSLVEVCDGGATCPASLARPSPESRARHRNTARLLLLLPRDTTGYWQQQVNYRITASLDEPTGVLSGRERISYVNRSSATLRDFYVHQYLNAFRPGSRWAAADSAEERDRFQHLGDPDYAFERITAATLGGREVRPDYPYAPDSTIAHWTLARPL